MVIQSVASTMVALFMLLIVGYILRKLDLIDARVTKGLSAMLTKAGMPAMMLYSLQQPYSPERLHNFWISALGITVNIFTGILLCWILSRIFKVSLREGGAWMSCAAFSNAVFMARPIMIGLYGDEAGFILTGIMFAFNFITFSVGIFLMQLGGESKSKNLVGTFFRSICNLSTACVILGFILFIGSISLPAPVLSGLEMLANITTPIAMIIIGSLLAGAKIREVFADYRVYLISAMRLIACPLLTILIMRPFLTDPVIAGVVVLASAMPTATTVAVLAEQYDNSQLLCSKTVFVSTVLSLATVPLMAWILL